MLQVYLLGSKITMILNRLCRCLGWSTPSPSHVVDSLQIDVISITMNTQESIDDFCMMIHVVCTDVIH